MSKLILLDSDGAIAACDDSDSLLAALRSCASDILRNLSRMAAILRRLDELGVQVEIEHALLPYIRMIANGSLSAECFIACSGDPSLLMLATKLPADLQNKLAANHPFKLLDPEGQATEVPVLEMTQDQVAQVFVSGRERSDHEKLLFAKRSSKYSRNAKDKTWKPDKYQRTLPSVPGGRCPDCGARLCDGAECVACQLKDKDQLAALKVAEHKLEGHRRLQREAVGLDDEAEDQLADGWQDRLAELRQVKQHGNEVGFHVDWLLTYMDTRGEDDSADATLYPLLEKLAARFGHELEAEKCNARGSRELTAIERASNSGEARMPRESQ